MIIKTIATALTIATCWLAVAFAVMLSGSIATAAVPLGTTLPPDIAVIGKTQHLLIVHSNDPSYVRKLYNSGAVFVLPARKKTCLTFQN